MDIFIYDTDFKMVGIIDSFVSFLWTDRFDQYGEFEIYTSADAGLLDWIKMDYYVKIKGSEHVMIVEKFVIESDAEDGSSLIISGRSLESILTRRIIWNQTTINGNLQSAITSLLDAAIVEPSISARAIRNFKIQSSTDPEITKLIIEEAQYTGDNLYEVITSLCQLNKIGFRILLDENNNFVFSLYSGTNRSYDQTLNPYVIFSPNYENLINSNYTEDHTNYKNVTLIAGEGEGSERKTAITGDESGLARREVFTDARDLSTNRGEISNAVYQSQLIERGKENLKDYKITKEIDGEAETINMFTINKDFFMGDIVQVVDSYGTSAKSRIKEIVTSVSSSEDTVYPTFEIENDEED